MKLIYVAGKFRGNTPWDVHSNVHRAERIALEVAKMGGVPVCPHTMYAHFDKSLPDEFWLEATMDLLRRCDAIILGVGWQDSTGSKAEKAEAERLGIPVFLALADLWLWLAASKDKIEEAST